MMKDMKMKTNIKRQILFMINGENKLVTIEMFKQSKLNEYEEKFEICLIEESFKELLKDKYISNGMNNKPFSYNDYFELTRLGQEYTEHIKNQKRWNMTMEICSKLEDFSERTVNSVYDQLVQKEINELVSTPLYEITNAMYQLAGEISTYNMRPIFGR